MELKGIDYFPFSVDFFENNKIALLEAEFGNDGMVVILKLLSKIYRNGYFLEWGTDECLLFARKAMDGMAVETVQAIVGKALDRGFFDRESFERFGILTSVEIQEQFFTVAAKRKKKLSNEMDYLLIDLSKYKRVRAAEFSQPKPPMDAKSDGQPAENPDPEGQSKGKKRKGNERIEEEHSLAPFKSGECESDREQWKRWKAELLADEDWQASAVRQSGQGIGFNEQLPGKIDEFCDFLVSVGEEKSAGTKKNFVRRFHYWLSYHGVKKKTGGPEKEPPRMSKFEEMNRVGDASLEMAKQILAGQCC